MKWIAVLDKLRVGPTDTSINPVVDSRMITANHPKASADSQSYEDYRGISSLTDNGRLVLQSILFHD